MVAGTATGNLRDKKPQYRRWEEYRMLLHLVRGGHQTARRLIELGHQGCRSMAQEWQKAYLRAVAWRHSWTRNAQRAVR